MRIGYLSILLKYAHHVSGAMAHGEEGPKSMINWRFLPTGMVSSAIVENLVIQLKLCRIVGRFAMWSLVVCHSVMSLSEDWGLGYQFSPEGIKLELCGALSGNDFKHKDHMMVSQGLSITMPTPCILRAMICACAERSQPAWLNIYFILHQKHFLRYEMM